MCERTVYYSFLAFLATSLVDREGKKQRRNVEGRRRGLEETAEQKKECDSRPFAGSNSRKEDAVFSPASRFGHRLSGECSECRAQNRVWRNSERKSYNSLSFSPSLFPLLSVGLGGEAVLEDLTVRAPFVLARPNSRTR